ncbi:sulfatase-like hydrolase/transferase [Lacibacter sp.]|uniref:sulfatase-like hydrolase/transferase n=1 Tax=Lacibacter sp. TaxID=1915409 RepID=UPI002B4AF693|nr:sulfatase-like hydrolase/transferase [Lacibacter sp.]HLP37613.1 sulfatase-like hydrolase/transferase [Lacibacter sp.]
MATKTPSWVLCLHPYIDAQIGKLIQTLKDERLYDNTIIELWSDNGWKLGEHNSWAKQTNFEIDTGYG